MYAFTDLAIATYCPRKLYYTWADGDRTPPEAVTAIRNLAFRYEELLEPTTDLSSVPIAVTPTQYRSNLGSAKARLDRWSELVDPADVRAYLAGKDTNGIAHKCLANPPAPVIISAGEPPKEGVWKPQSVRATAAAKALAWERQAPVEWMYVEYPAYGIIRKLRVTTRRKAAYRSAFRAVESLDGPPPRIKNKSRCQPCDYRETCGITTRSLRSRLSL